MNSGHVLTDEDRLKKTGKKNPGTSIINAIKHRRTCGSRCPIFETCPMMPLSVSRANPDSRCLLNLGGNVLIRRFINLMVKGEDGLINEINTVLYSYAQDIEVASPAVKKDYAMMCMQLHRQLYGDPRRTQFEAKPQLTVVINEMDCEGKIREVEVVPVLESGGINNAKLDIEAAKMIEASKEDDPDSLLNSPMFDDLFKNLPVQRGTSPEQRNTVQGKGGKFERKVNVQESDHRAEGDEPARTEREPEELAQASGGASGGS